MWDLRNDSMVIAQDSAQAFFLGFSCMGCWLSEIAAQSADLRYVLL
jgi:hypothetical protein